ncbi:MAG: DUF2061 domain-containing protein [Hydrogenophaga sp.]|uniref:DUF2061 domain-containing protein n=1 Tax=Hydrogenophaga sp. TaxID=1904254 RepID=UPI003452D738|nr:DUF2061 domain-containing protein [Hydrogenophaga sp.]
MRSLRRRLLAKTATYKTATAATSTLILGGFTGSFAVAGGLAIAITIINTLIYLGHEAAWNKVTWGRISEDSGQL